MLTWCEEWKAFCIYKQSTAQPEPGPVFNNNEVTTKISLWPPPLAGAQWVGADLRSEGTPARGTEWQKGFP